MWEDLAWDEEEWFCDWCIIELADLFENFWFLSAIICVTIEDA